MRIKKRYTTKKRMYFLNFQNTRGYEVRFPAPLVKSELGNLTRGYAAKIPL